MCETNANDLDWVSGDEVFVFTCSKCDAEVERRTPEELEESLVLMQWDRENRLCNVCREPDEVKL